MPTEISAKPLVLSVPKPCSEVWEKMTVKEGGRFCANCQKTVIDFSGLTDKDLRAYFSTVESPPCGRFHHTQLNRSIQGLSAKQKFPPLLYKRIAAVLAFLSLKQTAAFSQTQAPTTAQPTNKKAAVDTATQPAIIAGTIKNAEGIELEGVVISLNGQQVALTNREGKFAFEMNAPLKPSVINFAYPELVTVARSYHPAMASTSYAVVLEKPHKLSGYFTGMPAFHYNAFEPQPFKFPLEIMNNDLRAKFAPVAGICRNYPDVQILLVAYGTTQKEIKAAEKSLATIKTYFAEKEGIGEDRFVTKMKPAQKGKELIFEIEPYDPYSQD